MVEAADQVFDGMLQKYPELVRCKIGCSDCCHAIFDLTLIEAIYINNQFNKKFEGLDKQTILEKANSKNVDSKTIRPIEIKEPARMAKSLTFLKLKKADLDSPELQQVIKKAYRKQAKKYHPDQGGDAAVFRKLHEAYEQLVQYDIHCCRSIDDSGCACQLD